MTSSDSALWARIHEFHIGDPAAVFGFKNRIARENGWDLEFSARVIEEYKRFMFLAVRAGHPVTPSEAVDQAWHLHLVYTQSYWEEFCSGILGRPIHHGPTKGGLSQSDQFEDWYGKTLKSYEKFFGEKPPHDIWPVSEERFARREWEWVDRSRFWLIPKIRLPRLKRFALPLLAASLAFFITGCVPNILNVNGAAFLVIYLTCLLPALLFLLIGGRLFRNRGKEFSLESPIEIAMLNGGPKRAFATAMTSLVGRGLVEFKSGKKYSPRARRADPLPDQETELTDLESRFFSAIPGPASAKFSDLMGSLKPVFDDIKSDLVQNGALQNEDSRNLRQFFVALPTLGLIGLGGFRIFKGIANGHPFGTLFILVIFTMIAMIFLLKAVPRRTKNGDAYVKDQKKKMSPQLKSTLLKAPPHEAALVAPFAVAIIGSSYLNRVDGYAGLHDSFEKLGKSTASNGGCGAGCSGDGCGGGGGCGGCGGCGG